MKNLNEEVNKIKHLFNYKLGNLITEQDEPVTTGDTTSSFIDISGYDVNGLSSVEGQYPRSIKATSVGREISVYAYEINGKIYVKVPQSLGGSMIYVYDKSTFESETKNNGGKIPDTTKSIEKIMDPNSDREVEGTTTEGYEKIINTMKEQKASMKVSVNENTPKISLSTLKGKPFILDFWATWCGACRKSIDSVIKPLYGDVRQKGDRDLSIYFYSVDTDLNKLKSYVNTNTKGMGINVVGENGRESEGVKKYGVSVYPTTKVFDKDGNEVGPLPKDLEEAKKMIYPLLGLNYGDNNDENVVEPSPKGKG